MARPSPSLSNGCSACYGAADVGCLHHGGLVDVPMSPRGQRAGFTITEVLIVVLLFMLLGGGVLLSFLAQRTAYLTADAALQVQQEARRAFDSMIQELRESKVTSATVGQPMPEVDFQVALSYNLPVPCPPSGVCWGARDQNGANQVGWKLHYRVDRDKAQLVREVCDAGDVVQSTSVLANYINPDTTQFILNLDRSVTINFESRYVNPAVAGGMQTTGVLTSRVNPRNP